MLDREEHCFLFNHMLNSPVLKDVDELFFPSLKIFGRPT